MKLPENPTSEQVTAVCLSLTRLAFEDTAENFIGPEPRTGGGWQGTYEVAGQTFVIEYDGTSLTKWPEGGGQDDD
jgi:hypothetical protein